MGHRLAAGGRRTLRKADSMSIVITGSSGRLSRLTAELVLDHVPASKVVLTTRRPEALSDLAGTAVPGNPLSRRSRKGV